MSNFFKTSSIPFCIFNFGNKKIILGAATNYQKLFLDKKIRKSLKVLPQVSVWFADDQIRELATLGGNIVNASPAGDGMPALLTLNTKVTVAKFKNKKIVKEKMPLEKFGLIGKEKAIACEVICSISKWKKLMF